jgi:hypothetical protein
MGGCVFRNGCCRASAAQTLLSVLCRSSPYDGASTSLPQHCCFFQRRSRVAQTLLSVLCQFSPDDGARTPVPHGLAAKKKSLTTPRLQCGEATPDYVAQTLLSVLCQFSPDDGARIPVPHGLAAKKKSLTTPRLQSAKGTPACVAQTLCRSSPANGASTSLPPHCCSFLRRSRVAQTLLSVLCQFPPDDGAST